MGLILYLVLVIKITMTSFLSRIIPYSVTNKIIKKTIRWAYYRKNITFSMLIYNKLVVHSANRNLCNCCLLLITININGLFGHIYGKNTILVPKLTLIPSALLLHLKTDLNCQVMGQNWFLVTISLLHFCIQNNWV